MSPLNSRISRVTLDDVAGVGWLKCSRRDFADGWAYSSRLDAVE